MGLIENIIIPYLMENKTKYSFYILLVIITYGLGSIYIPSIISNFKNAQINNMHIWCICAYYIVKKFFF